MYWGKCFCVWLGGVICEFCFGFCDVVDGEVGGLGWIKWLGIICVGDIGGGIMWFMNLKFDMGDIIGEKFM